MNENGRQPYRQPGQEFRNQADYQLMRERLAELVRSDPYSRYGAHAVGIGERFTDGKPTNELAIRVYVAHKTLLAETPPERRVPGSFQIYSSERDQNVELISDVIETPPAVPLATPNPKAAIRPVPGGVSCRAAHNGTIGGWVWDNTDNTIVMLSNQHVFGNTPGTPIIQPHWEDSSFRIGQVKRGVPIYPYNHPFWYANSVDAAIGEADSSDLMDLTVLDIGPAIYEIMHPINYLLVEKFSMESEHTFGLIVDVDYHPTFNFPSEVSGQWITAKIFDSIRIESLSTAFQESGDSGSIVFWEGVEGQTKRALGLLYAGSYNTEPENNYGVACKMSNVFAALDLSPLFEYIFVWIDSSAVQEESDDNGEPASFQSPTPDVSPPLVTVKERRRQRARNFHSGLAADLGHRLETSPLGRSILDFLKQHQAELLTLAVRDGDTRRSIVAAIRPLFAGAITTDDVLLRTLTGQDFEQLTRLFQLVAGKGSPELNQSMVRIQGLFEGAAGRSLAEILRLT